MFHFVLVFVLEWRGRQSRGDLEQRAGHISFGQFGSNWLQRDLTNKLFKGTFPLFLFSSATNLDPFFIFIFVGHY